MSLATWKREHYPIPASQCWQEDALDHGLQKYLGTRPAVLKRHGLVRTRATLSDGKVTLHFAESTCALCQFYCKQKQCDKSNCGLAAVTGKLCGDPDSPYQRWVKTGDPEPMIRALRKAIKKQKAEGKKP